LISIEIVLLACYCIVRAESGVARDTETTEQEIKGKLIIINLDTGTMKPDKLSQIHASFYIVKEETNKRKRIMQNETGDGMAH
jgi:hypothetical protein